MPPSENATDLETVELFEKSEKANDMIKPPLATGVFRFSLLTLLVLQNTLVVVVTYYASLRDVHRQPIDSYSVSVIVFNIETLKVVICLLVLNYNDGFKGMKNKLNEFIVKRPNQSALLAIPSFIYVLQNYLNITANANLSPAIFTVVYQLKVISAAIINVSVFKRELSMQKWAAILFLFIGVTMAQWDQNKSEQEFGIEGEQHQQLHSYVLGIACALAACLTSGIAGTLMEWIMKTTTSSGAIPRPSNVETGESVKPEGGYQSCIWTKNLILASFGVVGATFAMLTKDLGKIRRNGMYNDFNYSLGFVIVLQAGGGLLVGAVLKYTDNIIKGFVTSLGVILSSLLSVYFFDFQVTQRFFLGSGVVFCSLYAYNTNQNLLKRLIRWK